MTVHRTSVIVHDMPVNAAGTGSLAHGQPECWVDFSEASANGLTWTLDVHGVKGSMDSFKLMAKFQLGVMNISGAGYSTFRWYDMQPEQIAKMIAEGVDWYGGVAPPELEANPFIHPQVLATTGYSLDLASGGGAASSSVSSGAGYGGRNAYRGTFTTASTGYNGGIRVSDSQGILVAANEQGTFSWYVRCSKQQRLRLKIGYYDEGGSLLDTKYGASTVVAASTLTRLTCTATSPANTHHIFMSVVSVTGDGASLWQVGDWVEASAPFYRPGTAPGGYFDGDSTDTDEIAYAWTGTAGASSSTKTTTITSSANVICRDTDALPLTVSRTIRHFGQLVRMVIWPVIAGGDADAAVVYSLATSY
ncbi:hypothetical protein [Mycobacterium sp. NAZ190054]|uniref:hypothetical protein n=1 Tax=Mycobacterium sp. NAZ190054 TaxID=1747766 RepID=UPI000AE2E044|nr:hypothetical protein [Mycobacterium sp. NAZ190054]